MAFRVSVVASFFNEAKVLPTFLETIEEALGDYDFELVAVDDGSSDETFEILRSSTEAYPFLRVVRLSRNFGLPIALRAGIDEARGDAVVTMDGDLQDPPEFIPSLIEKWQEGFDIVFATRTRRAGEPFWRRLAIAMFYRSLLRISSLPVPLDAGNFRLMSRRAVDQLKRIEDPNPYWSGLATWVGFERTTVEYQRAGRAAGESKFGLLQLFRLGWDGITSLSYIPLRMATFLGFLVSVGAFAAGIGVVAWRLAFDGAIPGWASLMTVSFFLSGVNLLMIGILGEYIGRIHSQVQRRPLYIVQEVVKGAG